MVDCVIVFKYQVAYKYKFVAIVFKAFKNCRQRLGGVVGIIVEKDNTAVFYLTCHPLTNTIGGGIFFPVEAVPVRSSWKALLLQYIEYQSTVLLRCFFYIYTLKVRVVGLILISSIILFISSLISS